LEKTIVIARKWGNSVGITLPKEVVEKEKIKPTDKLIISVTKAKSIEELFGTLKFKKTTEEMRRESKKGWG